MVLAELWAFEPCSAFHPSEQSWALRPSSSERTSLAIGAAGVHTVFDVPDGKCALHVAKVPTAYCTPFWSFQEHARTTTFQPQSVLGTCFFSGFAAASGFLPRHERGEALLLTLGGSPRVLSQRGRAIAGRPDAGDRQAAAGLMRVSVFGESAYLGH